MRQQKFQGVINKPIINMKMEKRKNQMKEIGVYIHIPFCKQKCYYCDFVSFVNKDCFYKKYIDALIKEITNFLDNNTVTISSLFVKRSFPPILNSVEGF